MTAQLAAQLQDALGPDYRIEQELDGGGMSRLFLATDLRHNRRVVVKVLSPELVSAQSAARFKREIELTVRLQHPHILPILTSGAWDDCLYYITPYIAGESLKARIEREGKLPLDAIVKILRDVSGALAFAHQRGIVHRDVKPGNILLAEGHAILADFGIARAVATNATPLTGSGMVPGTPAYMAPELPTDEKADVYALGVVAYEMLWGTLPKRGTTAREMLARRAERSGDSGRQIAALSRLIAAALSSSVSERIESAAVFHDALELSVGKSHVPWKRIAAFVAMGGAIAAAIALFLSTRTTIRPDSYAIAALGGRDSVKEEVVRRVTEALAEWTGPEVVREFDPFADGGRLAQSELVKRASRAHASGLLLLDVSSEDDSLIVRTTTIDTRTGSIERKGRWSIPRSASTPVRTMAYRQVANGLLRDDQALPWQIASQAQPARLDAWRAIDSGRQALRGWNLDGAERFFRAAILADPDVPQAQLWLAQTRVWKARTIPVEADGPIRRAIDRVRFLDPKDSAHAEALLELVEHRFPEACAGFRRVVERDSTDLAGWLGLADCNAQDHQTIKSARSSTGLVFRGSFEAASRAYQRAALLGPADDRSDFQGWLLGRLSTVIYAQTNRLRRGPSPDTVRFAGFPALDHDTLAFEAIDVSLLSSRSPAVGQESFAAAIRHNRELLRRFAEEWVRRSPHSAAAYDSLAGWMEVSGATSTVDGRSVSTLDVLRRARSISTDSLQQSRLAVAEVRLLLKDGRFRDARIKADSLLAHGVVHFNSSISGIAGLAAILGRVSDAANLRFASEPDHRIRLPNGSTVVPPAQLAQAAARFAAYCAMGAPSDSIKSLATTIDKLIESYYSRDSTAAAVRGELLGVPLTFVFPEEKQLLGRVEAYPDETTAAFILAARGDMPAARRRLDALRRSGRGHGTAIDQSYRRALLSIATADTASAIAELDPVLRALPTLLPSLLSQSSQAASLVRAMAMRAELAAASGDMATVNALANAVIELWTGADLDLQPVVSRMKVLRR